MMLLGEGCWVESGWVGLSEVMTCYVRIGIRIREEDYNGCFGLGSRCE